MATEQTIAKYLVLRVLKKSRTEGIRARDDEPGTKLKTSMSRGDIILKAAALGEAMFDDMGSYAAKTFGHQAIDHLNEFSDIKRTFLENFTITHQGLNTLQDIYERFISKELSEQHEWEAPAVKTPQEELRIA